MSCPCSVHRTGGYSSDSNCTLRLAAEGREGVGVGQGFCCAPACRPLLLHPRGNFFLSGAEKRHGPLGVPAPASLASCPPSKSLTPALFPLPPLPPLLTSSIHRQRSAAPSTPSAPFREPLPSLEPSEPPAPAWSRSTFCPTSYPSPRAHGSFFFLFLGRQRP